jgi:hypothetical protein
MLTALKPFALEALTFAAGACMRLTIVSIERNKSRTIKLFESLRSSDEQNAAHIGCSPFESHFSRDRQL